MAAAAETATKVNAAVATNKDSGSKAATDAKQKAVDAVKNVATSLVDLCKTKYMEAEKSGNSAAAGFWASLCNLFAAIVAICVPELAVIAGAIAQVLSKLVEAEDKLKDSETVTSGDPSAAATVKQVEKGVGVMKDKLNKLK